MGVLKIIFWGSETDCKVYRNFLEDDPNFIGCSEIVNSGESYGAKAELNIPEANE